VPDILVAIDQIKSAESPEFTIFQGICLFVLGYVICWAARKKIRYLKSVEISLANDAVGDNEMGQRF
jgi:hypothetical protein